MKKAHFVVAALHPKSLSIISDKKAATGGLYQQNGSNQRLRWFPSGGAAASLVGWTIFLDAVDVEVKGERFRLGGCYCLPCQTKNTP